MVAVQVELDEEEARRLGDWASAVNCSLSELVGVLVRGGSSAEDVAVRLFQARRVSLGRAAELAGMSVAAFLERLRLLDVIVLDNTGDDDI